MSKSRKVRIITPLVEGANIDDCIKPVIGTKGSVGSRTKLVLDMLCFTRTEK